jgi:hypothetical protein
MDQIKHVSFYRVHLENGFNIEINIGCMEFIVWIGQGEIHQNDNINNIIKGQDNEEERQTSSYKEIEEAKKVYLKL